MEGDFRIEEDSGNEKNTETATEVFVQFSELLPEHTAFSLHPHS
jgi:hypothetical protein